MDFLSLLEVPNLKKKFAYLFLLVRLRQKTKATTMVDSECFSLNTITSRCAVDAISTKLEQKKNKKKIARQD